MCWWFFIVCKCGGFFALLFGSQLSHNWLYPFNNFFSALVLVFLYVKLIDTSTESRHQTTKQTEKNCPHCITASTDHLVCSFDLMFALLLLILWAKKNSFAKKTQTSLNWTRTSECHRNWIFGKQIKLNSLELISLTWHRTELKLTNPIDREWAKVNRSSRCCRCCSMVTFKRATRPSLESQNEFETTATERQQFWVVVKQCRCRWYRRRRHWVRSKQRRKNQQFRTDCMAAAAEHARKQRTQK